MLFKLSAPVKRSPVQKEEINLHYLTHGGSDVVVTILTMFIILHRTFITAIRKLPAESGVRENLQTAFLRIKKKYVVEPLLQLNIPYLPVFLRTDSMHILHTSEGPIHL